MQFRTLLAVLLRYDNDWYTLGQARETLQQERNETMRISDAGKPTDSQESSMNTRLKDGRQAVHAMTHKD